MLESENARRPKGILYKKLEGREVDGSSLPACSRTMYLAYQSGQFAS